MIDTAPAGWVQIGAFSEGQADEVVRMHVAGLGYSLNALLGANHLRQLYLEMLRDPSCYVGVGLVDGKLRGVVSGSTDASAFESRVLRSLGAAKLAWIALQLLQRPQLLRLWFESAQVGRPVLVDGTEVRAVLTAIVVDSVARGTGVGRALVEAFERFLQRKGVAAYRLDTLIENEAARQFYMRLGFREVGRRAGSIILVRSLPA